VESARGVITETALRALTWGARRAGRIGPVRNALVAAAERRLAASAARPASELRNPPTVQADKVAIARALVHLAERALAEDRLSPASVRGLLGVLLGDVLLEHGRREVPRQAFAARYGCSPPDFLTISPGKACNLRCTGCYAASGPAREKLPWGALERTVEEAHARWGIRFFVLSGGEPFAYRDGGLGILDLASRHPDCYFLCYTNGTLIDDATARRLGEVGNLSPGLSVEGLRGPTDARRGAGVFDRVVDAMGRLRREGVVFGLSLTATRETAGAILSDEVVDLFFGRLGALYAWVFHYMPIGRAFTLDLMPTPAQRMRLYERAWQLVRERRLLVADFWTSGTATNGCVAGGRPGGYLHVNWNGDVSPCVFVPYSPVNVHEVFARGGTLDEVWAEPFFAAIRAWQRDYGYREAGEACPECRNWLRPCLIRDHHEAFVRIVEAHRPRPTDDDARAALEDSAYHEGLFAFGEELAALADPVWEERYLTAAPESA